MAEQSDTTNPSTADTLVLATIEEVKAAVHLFEKKWKALMAAAEVDDRFHRPQLYTGRYGHLELSPEHFAARWKGVDVRLTVRAYLIVEHLASLRGLDSSYRELYDVVRGVGFVVGDGELGLRQAVRTWIKRIRDAFRAADPGFNQIEVRAGYGYHWRSPTMWAEPHSGPPPDPPVSIRGGRGLVSVSSIR